MALIYLKSYLECSDSIFDGHINDENSKAGLRINLGFECRN